MVNNKPQLITSAATLLLLMLPFSMEANAQDWVPNSPEDIVLEYKPAPLSQPIEAKELSPTKIQEILSSAKKSLSESKYPTKNEYLLLGKKSVDKLSRHKQQLSPEQFEKYILLQADIAQSQHQFEQALSKLTKIKPSSKVYAQSLLEQARIKLLQGQVEEAEKHCKELLKYHIQAAELCLIDTKLNLEDTDHVGKSLDLLERRYEQADSLSHYFHQIAGSFYQIKGNLNKAEEYFEYNLQGAPTSQWYQWADTAIENGKSDLVYKKLSSLVKTSSNQLNTEDGLLVRLARVEKSTTDDNVFQNLAAQRIKLRELRNDKLHAADVAYYYLYVSLNPDSALKWAKVNWSNVKEPSDKNLLKQARKIN